MERHAFVITTKKEYLLENHCNLGLLKEVRVTHVHFAYLRLKTLLRYEI